MELSKHRAHRNPKYLEWLRGQKCAVSGQPAECAHHIRLGTNGGAGLKPSDYFCIPLLNDYHVCGINALHVIGEETFLTRFGLDPKALFIRYLKRYLIETFDIYHMLEGRSQEETIAELIGLIENKLPKLERPGKKKQKNKRSLADDEFYQRAKELKKKRDKELRKKLKEKAPPAKSPSKPSAKMSFKGNEAYERAKELKRQRDKELRKKLKAKNPPKPASLKGQEFYEKAKEKRRQMDKEYRKKKKELLAARSSSQTKA